MRTSIRIGLVALLLLVGALIVLAVLRVGSEPVYRGHKLSLWLAQGAAGFDQGADAFLQQNSTVVNSYLLSSLRKPDNALWKPYTWLRARAPSVVSSKLPLWVEPRLVRAGCTYWLAQMGPRAAAAIPDLQRAAAIDTYSEVRRNALWALGKVDSGSSNSIAVLVKAMSADKDAGARQAAAGVLEVWTPQDAKVIATLIHGLEDSDAIVRQVCAAALGRYGVAARAAVPALTNLAGRDDPATDYAVHALEQIGKAATEER